MARALEKRLPFATHPAYGYLSANPDNLGTGLRLYCTFSFFGLFLNKELDAVLRGIERLGLNVYPLYLLSEKEDNPLEAPGCCYVVASTQTMGRESDIIEGMEQSARARIAETNAAALVDSRIPTSSISDALRRGQQHRGQMTGAGSTSPTPSWNRFRPAELSGDVEMA